MILLIGCMSAQHLAFDDDLDPTVDFAPTQHEGLNSPYVRGASFDITVRRDGVRDLASESLVSSDDQVLDVVDLHLEEGELVATVEAIGEGEAFVEVHDDRGRVVDARRVEVALPAEVELRHEHVVRMGLEDQDWALAAGGQGTYVATYRDEEGRRLAGSGVLEARSPGWVIEVDHFVDEDADWIVLDAAQADQGVLRLNVDGELIETREVPIAAPWEIDGVVVERESDVGLGREHLVRAWAVGLMADGTLVHGLDIQWHADGVDLTRGDTQLYRPDGPETALFASFGELQDHQVVSVSGFVGNVGGTSSLGCSASGLGASMALGLVGLLAVRRRR